MADIQRQTYGLETKLWWTMPQSGRDLNVSRFEKKKSNQECERDQIMACVFSFCQSDHD